MAGPSAKELKGLSREEKYFIRLKHRNPLRHDELCLSQKLGRKLTWAEKTTVALQLFHPELRDAWGDLEANLKIITPVRAEQPSGLRVTLLPFQQESLYWMRKQELGPYAGGLLADEMGMGKTIQMISLMVSEPGKPNLVVAPTVAIMQWRNEIEAHTDDMKVLVWHGSARETDVKALKKYDVVLTTYAVLESCFRKQLSGFKRHGLIIKEKSPIHGLEWNRVILDEAHNIKERATNTAKAAFELNAKYRWCLSGTPLQNRVGELYSLVRFLNVDPFSFYYCKRCSCKSLHWRFENKKQCDECGHSPMQHTCFWNNEILTPIQKHAMVGPGQVAFRKLRILLDRIMLRRTKVQRADDLGLPPRTIIVRRDYFSPEEKELYLSLFSDAKREFSTYVDAGTLLNNYSNIFSLLTRMRQMACHPDLVIRSKQNAGTFVPADDECTVCRLCNDIAEDAIQAKCQHIFDRECIKQYVNTAIEAQPDCPICHVPLTIDLEAEAIETVRPTVARQGILGRLDLDTWRSSTKIEALIEELSNLRLKDSTTKSIVFSQFVNFLDLIAFRLQRAGFVVCRLEGTMTPQARDATIKHFMNNVNVTVFLVSLKAGGVALNLTEASRVYLMDSWWNPAVEFQAMDRIHRLGQHRPIQAIKLVVQDSIESRIVQLQEKKSAMVDATLSTDDSAMGRLTPEDVRPSTVVKSPSC
ncbi:SNF2 family N-terminal domain-containing protein [Vararia minispora EC-137]|uniref:SNF2 family N-terminal domain-containing protein n=1 Tax=Vararia minispora EC-137 TaxID=1314806 RepID=A0ACB8QRT0_9AGAM|nr:SNF2 family N-terminal domain-containing protein [Vararia minispora EC-137]